MIVSEVEYSVPWIMLGYLFGSCPTGFVLVRLLKGADVRSMGSGNIGATNVSRVLGKKWGAFTAAADMFKGAAAMCAVMLYGRGEPELLALVGAAGVIGHNYPVWIGFRGGKGVATSFGVIAFFNFFHPAAAVLGGLVWLAAREISLMVSLASMIALGSSALFMAAFGFSGAYVKCGLFLCAFSVWRHRENIKRIMAGSENKVKPFFPERDKPM